MPRSLRVQLIVGLLGPLAVVLLVLVTFAYRTAALTAQTVTDRLLLGSARTIAEQIVYVENRLETVIPPAALSMFDFGAYDTVYYRVTGSDGRLLAGYDDLPAQPGPARATFASPSYYDGRFRNEAIRLVAVRQLIPAPGRTLWATVTVAETLNDRNAMVRSLWIGNAEQQASLVLIAAALAWFVLRRGLTPALRFSTEVAERQPNDFRPFAAQAMQSELRPLVDALNGYMVRLRAQLEAQRRFTANAAHQLRTPLTLLRTQATYALRSASESDRHDATRAVLATMEQLTRLTNQLLSLARVEPDGHLVRRDPLDVALLARVVLEDFGQLAVDRHVDLAFDVALSHADAPLTLADPAMLRDLIVNVVDNAIRATPPGGLVTVGVDGDDATVRLRVEDTGPGIAAAQRERVFERFYRVRADDSEGSGLGLAIVREIVLAHGGSITLHDRASGPGLVLEVRLPRARTTGPLSPDVAEGWRAPL